MPKPFGILRESGIPGKVALILKEHGKPLHYSVILKILLGRYGIEINRHQLCYILANLEHTRKVESGVWEYRS